MEHLPLYGWTFKMDDFRKLTVQLYEVGKHHLTQLTHNLESKEESDL